MKIFGMETKKMSLWLVVIFIVSAAISGVFLLTSGMPRSIRNGEEWPPLSQGNGRELIFDESREFQAEGIDELEIRLSFEDTEIKVVEGDVITVWYHGTAISAGDTSDVFFAEQSGRQLILESKWSNNRVRNGNITLEVGIPVGILDKLTVNVSSGNITVQDFSSDSAVVKTSSGTVTAENWKIGNGVLVSSSGNLKLNSISATGKLELKISSGNIEGTDIEASVIESRVSSGRTVLKGVSGSLVSNSSSGRVDVEFRNPGNSININVSSGRIDIGLPEGTDFMLDARATSGNIHSDFALLISGSVAKNSLQGVTAGGEAGGGRSVELKSSSGNISLREI
ncbi:MAG: DUF4097 family beta strand repeat protein [Spirochaetaceae bacterium]|nr:DUF4097 family beta strand repeat protein [Spirochaetaceae bacterium]